MLEFRNISKQFSGVEVLHGVSFSVEKGKVVALVGENGAGKSTLMKILCGIYPDYQGEVIIKKRLVRFKNPREAEQAGIAMIHQELNLVPDLSIAENIFLGKEPVGFLGLIDGGTMLHRAETILKEFDFPYSPKIKIKNIPVGWQQMVEIAKALWVQADIFVMDEPTSALSESEIKVLFDKIRVLKKMGKTIIYISHRMSEIFSIADETVVLRDGEFIAHNLIAEVSHEKLVRLMIGREISDRTADNSNLAGDEVLAIKGLKVLHENRYILSDINFALKRGEVLGIAGLLGAGRTELLKYLYGEIKGEAEGDVHFRGGGFRPKSAADSIERGIAYLPEDRKREGIFPELNLVYNSSISILKNLATLGFINQTVERAEVARQFDDLKLKRSSLFQKIATLSGGNQQKVLLSRVLSSEPGLLLLDEPTRGIDVGAKKEIYDLIRELSTAGISVIVTSSEIPELLKICHRILVLSQGSQRAILNAEHTDSQEILRFAFVQD